MDLNNPREEGKGHSAAAAFCMTGNTTAPVFVSIANHSQCSLGG